MPPLVLLPGMNCSADLWSGCGLQGRSVELTEPTMSAQVDRLARKLPEQCVLVGLSLGGIVAMALAGAAPNRVAALCVMSTNAKEPTDAQREGWREWLQRIDAGETADSLQSSIIGALLSPAAREDPLLVERVLAMGRAVGERQLEMQLRLQATRSDLLRGLARLRVPTLVISGSADAICPPRFHIEIAQVVPEARMVTLAAGHLLPMEKPSAVGDVIGSWASSLG